jgi:hypothetical protein
MPRSAYASQVFINCPFDRPYDPIFDALIFVVLDCGFYPRSALEIEDAAEARIEKIYRVIKEAKFGIHDISRIELDQGTGLPRFNMPLELGVFLGARRFGDRLQRLKSCLILDSEPHRYRSFISDIGGQDIKAHGNDPKSAVALVRGWLVTASDRRTIPGGQRIWLRYQQYRSALPDLCAEAHLEIDEMTYVDRLNFAAEWLKQVG